MAHTDTVVNITQCEFEKLVRENGTRISEAKERVIGKNSPQAHCARMQDSFMAKTAETAMAMHNLNTFANANVPEGGKEREDGRKGGGAVDDEEGNVVDLDAVCEVANTLPVIVGVGDDDDLVATIDELCCELVDVRFDASWLREEEVANHGDVVCAACHDGG
jgi:hypothetical protein